MKTLGLLTFLLSMIIACQKSSHLETSAPEKAKEVPFIFDRSYGDFNVRVNEGDQYRMLTFSGIDSLNIYRYVKITVVGDSLLNLSSELKTLDLLWDAAMDSIKTDLKSISVGYPLLYEDILKNQIDAFVKDSTWRQMASDARNISYPQLRIIMKEKDVYSPFNNWLQEKGYRTANLSTEKHGFVPESDLKRLGYTGGEIVPVPFMVWLELEKFY